MKDKVQALQQLTSKLAKQLDVLGVDLDDFGYQVKELSHELSRKEVASCGKGELRKPEGKMEPAAPAIARSAVLEWGKRGWAVLYIDNGRKGIRLTPRLAALVEVLIDNGGIVNDRLVGWKSKKILRAALANRTGRNYASIRHLVHLVRRELQRHGESAELVQFHHFLGYRFAVIRRGQSPNTPLPDEPATDLPPSGGNSAGEDA